MAKAVTEVAIGAAALGAAIAIPGGGIAIGSLLISHAAAVGALSSIAMSSVMSGIADALKGNQGGLAVAVTTPIGPWGYIYGTQKVGGVEIFRESNSGTGADGSTSNDKQLHRVYVLACHPCAIGSDFQLRIDGKQVLLRASGSDYVSYSPTQIQGNLSSVSRTNGVVTMRLSRAMPAGTAGTTLQMRSIADNTFNGTYTVTQPDPSDFTTWCYVCGGPDTSTHGGSARTTYSDYKDKIRVSFLNGNHTSTFATLLNAGTSWTNSDLCLGRTLAYVQMGYDESVFPSSIPNVSFVIKGKSDILDPRSGLRGWTDNAALCIADYLSIPAMRGGFGLQIGTDIPTAQLIAAANVCDETLTLNTGGTIAQYHCDTFFQLNTARGTILKNLLSACAGRITYQGGQYMVVPGSSPAATLSLTDDDLVGPIQWRPTFSVRDTCNAVKGTYISPENAYQQADVPAYMQNAEHGFATDVYLAEDDGERIFRDANFPCTSNSAAAQRLEKIALMRTRYQGRGTLRCSLKAYQAVALDIILLTHARYEWYEKPFEVLKVSLGFDASADVPLPYVELEIAETDADIYGWSPTEQLTPQGYMQPNNVGNRICNPPEGVSAYSGPGETVSGITYPATVTTGADGRVLNSIYAAWTSPNDANVANGGHIEVQWESLSSGSWRPFGKFDASVDSCFITGVTDGADYDVRVRAVNCAGVPSEWVVVGPVTVSNVLSSLAYSGVAVAPAGTLAAQALADGTAQITISSFVAKVAGLTESYTASPSVIGALAQSQLYYVYFVDANFAGGTITPMATQDPADFVGRAGYFLIGQIVTPSYAARYQPSTYGDYGSSSTVNPRAAFDNDTNTDAIVSARWWSASSAVFSASGSCTWSGFPAITTTGGLTLHVLASTSGSSSRAFALTLTARVSGATTTLLSTSSALAEVDYTVSVPSGTDLSTISVTASAFCTPGTAPGSGSCSIQGFEIFIQ